MKFSAKGPPKRRASGPALGWKFPVLKIVIIMLLYSGIAIIAVVVVAAIFLMKKKNTNGETPESTQESVSEAPEQSAAENNMNMNEQGEKNESAEEENFSVPVSAEEEKPKDDFNMQ